MRVPVLLIGAAFDSAMKVFNAANLVNGQQVDLVFENERYVPTVGTPYQETFLLPALTQQRGQGVNGTKKYTGIYQVTLNYPRDEGAGAAAGRADLLCAYFSRSAQLSQGGVSPQVEGEPSVSPARITNDWYILVVSIPYFIYS